MDNNKNISLFAVSFKQGFVSPNIPIATFHQGDKDITFILDSGSDNNVIDSEAVKGFVHKKVESNDAIHLSGVGGSKDTEKCSLSFECEEETYTTDFLITDIKDAFELIKKEHGFTLHGILGSNFLREHNIILDFKNLAAYNKQ